MCDKAVKDDLWVLEDVPDHFKTQEICERVVENKPETFQFIPNHFKTQEICDKAIKVDSSSLQYVPDWFVRREGVYMWYDDYYDDGDHWDDDGNKVVRWLSKTKGSKSLKKEELMSIAWHPSRYWDRCMSEDEK